MINNMKIRLNRQCTDTRHIETLSSNHCCSGGVVRITYSDCVYVALVIPHVMRMRYIVSCSLWGLNIYIFYLFS